MAAPERTRRVTDHANECSREVALIGEAHVERDVGYRPVGALDERGSGVDPPSDQKSVRWDTYALLESAREVARRQFCQAGKFCDVELLREAVVNVIPDPLEGARRKASQANPGGRPGSEWVWAGLPVVRNFLQALPIRHDDVAGAFARC